MFSFFKNWFGKNEQELKTEIREQSTVEADKLTEVEAVEKEAQAAKESKMIRTELSLHPSWEQQLDSEKKYTLRFLQSELPMIAEGLVGVTGFSLIPVENGATVALFFRNASPRPAIFKNIGLAIYLDDKVFARHRFDLTDLSAVPPYSSRPWEVFFPADSFLEDNREFSRWKVVMTLSKRVWPNHLELDPAMEERMTEGQKDGLERLVNALPPMRQNEVEIVGFDIGKTEQGHLVVGMLFRNAKSSVYHPEKLRVKVYDAEGDVVVSGTMNTEKVHVSPGTSRPWMVMFPADILKKPDADLHRWTLDIVK